MQGLVLSESEPLYGRARELVRLSPLKVEWMKVAFPSWSNLSFLEHYGVWGGVPRYWELSVGERGLWDTLRHQVFSPQGLLRTEPGYLLMDDLADSVQASSVLTLIGMGSERLNEIASRLQVPATALTRPLKRLVDLGLVRKEMPFGADAKGNKRTLYKVDDPFLAFWYRFVLPNFSDEQYLSDPHEVKEMKAAYRTYLGGVWERLVRETLGYRSIPGCVGRFRNAARWWGNGIGQEPMEVDIVAESTDRRTLLVGEAKLKLTDVESRHELAELKKKASLLPFAQDYEKVVCRLFVA